MNKRTESTLVTDRVLSTLDCRDRTHYRFRSFIPISILIPQVLFVLACFLFLDFHMLLLLCFFLGMLFSQISFRFHFMILFTFTIVYVFLKSCVGLFIYLFCLGVFLLQS